MKKLVLFAVMSVAWGSPAFAGCESGSPSVITVESWSAEAKKMRSTDYVNVSVTIKSGAAKPFRMVDASIEIEDALGRRIGVLSVDPDLVLQPGESIEKNGSYLADSLERLPKMNRDDVIITACTEAVVYQDGSKQSFTKK